MTYTVARSGATVSARRTNADMVILAFVCWAHVALRKTPTGIASEGWGKAYCTIVSSIPWYQSPRGGHGARPADVGSARRLPTDTKVSSTFHLVVAHAQAAAIVTKRATMESELGAVVDALPGLVWTAFPDGKIDYLNQRWSDYTGLGVEESRGRGWQASVHPEDLPRLLADWQTDSASRVPVDTQVRLRGPDGKYRWFLFCAHPSADASGQLVKWCGLGTDIDERMQAEEALRERERRFRSIVDGLPVLFSTATPDGELAHANRHYLEYFGATLEELKASEAV